jgi:hypothetical protein
MQLQLAWLVFNVTFNQFNVIVEGGVANTHIKI